MDHLHKLVRPRALVVGSGGFNGLYMLGALQYLDELGLLRHVRSYYGTSIGALLVALLNMGYSAREMCGLATAFDLSKLIHASLDGILEDASVISVAAWDAFLSRALERKGFRADLTLQELNEQTRASLTMIAYDLTDGNQRVLSAQHTPALAVKDAIRMSTSLPALMQLSTFEGRCFVDGAVCCPFPMRHVTEDTSETIGVCLRGPQNITSSAEAWNPATYLGIMTWHLSGQHPNVVYVRHDSRTSAFNPMIDSTLRASRIQGGMQQCRDTIQHVLESMIHANLRTNTHTIVP